MERLHVKIRGDVQGVSYRAHANHGAKALKLGGWVRNLPNGDVEIVAEGDKETLERFLQHLKRGPPMAKIEFIDVKWEKAEGKFRDFLIVK